MQNPPSVPVLPVVWAVARVKGATFVVDWHNYGWSILSLSGGSARLLVPLYQWIELTFGKMADGGFCVSNAMKVHFAFPNHPTGRPTLFLAACPKTGSQPCTTDTRRIRHRFRYRPATTST